MEGLKNGFQHVVAVYATVVAISVISANGQISSPCTASMISSFTPCFNFITGSSGNGASPTADCCSALKSLMTTSMDCSCLVITGNVPIQFPFNRTLALALPRACDMPGVPVQCKASATPLPAPGPVLLGPSPPPQADAPLSPRASKAAKAAAAAPPPEPVTTIDLSPASPPVNSKTPTPKPRIRPVLTPSASHPSYISSSPLLLMVLGIMVFKCY